MREWIDAQLAAGLPGLKGTTISGTLAVKEELINELLARALVNARQPLEPAKTPPLGRAADFVKQVAVRAETGTLLVDFTVAVD